ncbi:MAG: hypothetical protein KOO66_04970 [Bacteroidales bacterium]|nr:hypothetical protein [Bacteroidales bacterium]
MKPEKFIGIMLITLLLSCEMEEQVDQKIGEVTFETNQQIMNSSFDIDVYIDGKKVGSLGNSENINPPDSFANKFEKQLLAGVHNYEVKVYSYNGEPGKSIKGRFIIKENKKSEVFVDFKEYNNWQ